MKSPIATRKVRIAFTLTELLVVITIIVILLALVAPAMDRAMYQAELAICGSRLHAIGGGVQAYALNYQRSYPYRTTIHQTGFPIHVISMQANPPAGRIIDDRRVLQTFLSLNGHLNDPLAGDVDLERSKPDTVTFATYVPWFGARYLGDPGMLRIGQKLTWTSSDGSVQRRIGLLASDQNIFYTGNAAGASISSHPDHGGIMANELVQDKDASGTLDPPFALPSSPGSLNSTLARWYSRTTKERGLLDLNFAYDDNSVQRYNSVGVDDPRFNGSPGPHYFNSKNQPDWAHRLPLN